MGTIEIEREIQQKILPPSDCEMENNVNTFADSRKYSFYFSGPNETTQGIC